MNTKIFWILFIILFGLNLLYGEIFDKKTYKIIKTASAPKIDGILDDSVWDKANTADNFTQFLPESGKPGIQPTEVRLLFDDRYIYVAARMYDDPEKIASQLLRRDNRGYSDEFGIGIDSYNDKRTGFSFYATPKGTKQDYNGCRDVGQA